MSEATSHGQASPFNATPLRTGLRARIAWICQALRLAAVIWVVWEFVFVVIHWSDKAAVVQSYERLFSTVLVVSTARYALAFGVVMVAMAASSSSPSAFGGSPGPIWPGACLRSMPRCGFAAPGLRVSPDSSSA